MRQNGIPPVFRVKWPIDTALNYPDLDNKLSWSPWGVFRSENIHCYTEDYRFEITWRKPELSLRRVLDLNFVISPDFSVYQDAPGVVNRWQLYRSLAVFSYWQSMGARVIPSINWVSPGQIRADSDLYLNFPIIAVRCPTKDYLQTWLESASEINRIVRPEIVLHFGTSLGIEVWKNAFNYCLRPLCK